jgi:uncharacterized membrane protein
MRKLVLFMFLLGGPFFVHAQAPVETVFPATVVEVEFRENDSPEEFDDSQYVIAQTKDGRRIEFDNAFTFVEPGQSIFVRQNFIDQDGTAYYSLYDINRTTPLFFLLGLFVLGILLLCGVKGVRAIVSLAFTVFAVVFILLPVLRTGISVTLLAPLIAGVILGISLFLTHGFNKGSLIAMAGTTIAIGVTALLTWIFFEWAYFTGLQDDVSQLFIISGLSVDILDILYVGIIIGMMGVLDDVAITQVSVVGQLHAAGKRGKELFQRALRVGQDHSSALVNTLVLAYAGASLPLLVLTSFKEEPFFAILSIELIASEIARALLGSIGVLLSVPVTTFLATLFPPKETHGHSHVHANLEADDRV